MRKRSNFPSDPSKIPGLYATVQEIELSEHPGGPNVIRTSDGGEIFFSLDAEGGPRVIKAPSKEATVSASQRLAALWFARDKSAAGPIDKVHTTRVKKLLFKMESIKKALLKQDENVRFWNQTAKGHRYFDNQNAIFLALLSDVEEAMEEIVRLFDDTPDEGVPVVDDGFSRRANVDMSAPESIVTKKGAQAWISLLRGYIQQAEVGSSERKALVKQAIKEVDYAAWVFRTRAVGKFLATQVPLLKELEHTDAAEA